MKKITYIIPAVRVKNVAPMSLMQFSNNGDGNWSQTVGDNDEETDDDGRAKGTGDFNVWED